MSAEIIDYNSLIKHSTENQKLFAHDDKCDKYDYLIAAACGAVGGLMDIFLVGAPGDSVLGKWSDSQVDNAVKGFAKLTGWNPRPGKENSIASAIGHLEKKFPVNYDQRHTADVGGSFSMSAKDHHFKSLAHSPDIIGLFFSIVNQFTSTASFVSNGQLITIDTETFELQGGNFVAKLFCAVANWIGHIMSDAAGSSGSRGGMGRGSGVVMPFYELFGFCNFGKFNIGQDKQTLAELADRAFKEGFDLRFGIAQAIPAFSIGTLYCFFARKAFTAAMIIYDPSRTAMPPTAETTESVFFFMAFLNIGKLLSFAPFISSSHAGAWAGAGSEDRTGRSPVSPARRPACGEGCFRAPP